MWRGEHTWVPRYKPWPLFGGPALHTDFWVSLLLPPHGQILSCHFQLPDLRTWSLTRPSDLISVSSSRRRAPFLWATLPFFFFSPGFFYFINSCVVFRMKKASQSVNSIYCLSHTSFDWLLTIIWTPNLSLIIFLHMFVMFLESLTLSSAYPPQGMNKQFPPPAMLSSRLFTWLTFHLPAWVTLPESPSLATRCKWLFLLFPSSWL